MGKAESATRTYGNMAAAFVSDGAIDAPRFSDANTERFALAAGSARSEAT
jgi:hypothetical protein